MRVRRRRRQAGFTIVELAIVIAAIAILTGVVVMGGRYLLGDAAVSTVKQTVLELGKASNLYAIKNCSGVLGAGACSNANMGSITTFTTDGEISAQPTPPPGFGPYALGVASSTPPMFYVGVTAPDTTTLTRIKGLLSPSGGWFGATDCTTSLGATATVGYACFR